MDIKPKKYTRPSSSTAYKSLIQIQLEIVLILVYSNNIIIFKILFSEGKVSITLDTKYYQPLTNSPEDKMAAHRAAEFDVSI